MKVVNVVIGVSCLVLMLCVHTAQARTWHYKGKSLEGEFQRQVDDVVVIKKYSGGVVLIPMHQLSDADQSYVLTITQPGYRPPSATRQSPSSTNRGGGTSTRTQETDIWADDGRTTPATQRSSTQASPSSAGETSDDSTQEAEAEAENDNGSGWSIDALKERFDSGSMSSLEMLIFMTSSIFGFFFFYPLLCFLQARYLFGQSELTFSASTGALILGYIASFVVQFLGNIFAYAAGGSEGVRMFFGVLAYIAGISTYAGRVSIGFGLAILIMVISTICVAGTLFGMLFFFLIT